MGKHKEWRKIAKRERRRRIRTQIAKEREMATEQNELLESVQLEQIMLSNEIENNKWLEAEKIAMDQWNKLQEYKKRMIKLYLEEEAKIKLEWELELKKKEIEEERLRKLDEDNKKKQAEFIRSLECFLSGDSEEPSQELLIFQETRPNMEICPFFFKTACCRFGNKCSRNHQHPTISKVLLAQNFFNPFGFDDNVLYNEYDTDILLECDDSERYEQFKEFYYDVLPEFEKYGRVIQFKVCSNYEKHLRGNTYIEFKSIRSAVTAYRSLHSRWYGGRQLSLEFCTIHSWKSAICGLQLSNRCPKGRSCNFLHVFENPGNRCSVYETTPKTEKEHRSKRSSRRTWRWSESPEHEISKRRKRSKERSERRHQHSRKRVKRSRSPA